MAWERQRPMAEWLHASGEMAGRIRAHDWSDTPLGAAERWPAGLKAVVELMLASPLVSTVALTANRLLLYNDAAARLYGAHHPGALGRPLGEAFPDAYPAVADVYDRVFAGESVAVREQPLAVGTEGGEEVFDAYLTPVRTTDGIIIGAHMVGLEVGGRMRAEALLRHSEERQAFLLRLSDALRSLADPVVIQGEAARILGEHLDADRTYYVALNEARQIATVEHEHGRGKAPGSLVGEHPYVAYGATLGILRTGRTASFDDVEVDPAVRAADLPAYRLLALRAFLSVPLVKNGELVCAMCVTSATPRRWTAEEIRLVEETAERTWAAVERARAEAASRQSEERLRQFGEASQDILWIRDAETFQWEYLTPAFETIYGLDRATALRGDNMANWLELILPEDRERATASLDRVRGGEWVTFEYRIRRPADGGVRWLRNTDFPMVDASGEIVRIGGVGHDITDHKRTEEALAAAELRQRTLMEGIPQLVWRSCDQGLWTWASPQWLSFTGQRQGQSHGRGWLDAIHPDDRAATMRAWDEARPHGRLDIEYRVRRASDGAWVWHHTRSVPVRDADGRILEWLGTSTDIQALRELQDQQHVLVAELQHRTRNLMGVVRSMSDKTARASADLPDFQARFRDRLDALSRVQGLLSRLNEHNRVTFDELIEAELAAMDGAAERVSLEGPRGVRLRSSTVQTLAMAVHELATNAVKYGALGQPDGRLAITWSLDADEAQDSPWLRIDWRESGVAMPAVDATSARGGQGRELIERALPYQLSAKTSYTLGPDGVHCTICVPVSRSSLTREPVHA